MVGWRKPPRGLPQVSKDSHQRRPTCLAARTRLLEGRQKHASLAGMNARLSPLPLPRYVWAVVGRDPAATVAGCLAAALVRPLGAGRWSCVPEPDLSIINKSATNQGKQSWTCKFAAGAASDGARRSEARLGCKMKKQSRPTKATGAPGCRDGCS